MKIVWCCFNKQERWTDHAKQFSATLSAVPQKFGNHPDHPTFLCKAMLFAAGIFFFGLGGVAAKELHESFSVQAALIAAALMAAVAGGLVPMTG